MATQLAQYHHPPALDEGPFIERILYRGAPMRAWTVDADDIRVAEDFDEALLHRTPEIESFLSSDRDDKFIVIGTKGFGKTLLLKAKRILYQRAARAACLPIGNLLDKPIGDKIFSKEALGFFAASSLPWSKSWLTAIALTTLKHLGQIDGLRVNPRLGGLIADDRLRSVIDHFIRLLDFAPSDLQRCATDTDGHLVPRLRAVNSSVAIFIDGVDEYFNKHIESRMSHPSVTGQLSPSVWYFAQLGLVEVAYQLRRINHHLKVFAAVRKEAYARLQTTVMSQQYRGSAIDIVYPVESLREIFVNNIRLEKSDKMVRPERLRADPLEAFLGRTQVTHIYTGEQEDVFDYVCRHTLLRPRDLMTIGERLAALRPEERRNEHRLKETINLAATEIAHEYLTEIAPHVGDLDLERFLRRIPGHILGRGEVEELFREHNGDVGAIEERHVCCALYRVGLLGVLHHDWVRGAWVQRFLRPGEGTLDPDGVLPRATHYLVHPVLSDVIGRLNPGYPQRIDRVNIVGYGRPWRGTPSGDSAVTIGMLCVLAGDVHGFGGLMRAGADAPVRQALDEAMRKWAQEAVVAETRGGDAVWIVHEDPVALAQIARHITDEVYRVPGQPRLRIALHYGEVQTGRRASDGALVIAGGEAVLCAARVEPHVLPGQIWVTEEFRQQLAQTPSLWRTTAVAAPDGAHRINVKKEGGTEPDLWVQLYRLEF
jgi:class 3 adenylate cyclase